MRSSLRRCRSIVTLALLCAAGTLTREASSQAPAAPTQGFALAGIAHAALRTTDLAAARAFFEKLGFVQAFELTKDGVPTEEFMKINDRQYIELYPQGHPTDVLGFMHVCFEGSDLATLNQAYTARGLTPTPVKKAGAGNLLFVLRGPDQEVIEFTQYMPGSMHSNDQGKHLGEHRISSRLLAVGESISNPHQTAAYFQQKLDFGELGVREGAEVAALPGPSGEALAFLPKGTGHSFALVFAVDDLKQAAAQLRAAGFAPRRLDDRLLVDGPENGVIVFTQEHPR